MLWRIGAVMLGLVVMATACQAQSASVVDEPDAQLRDADEIDAVDETAEPQRDTDDEPTEDDDIPPTPVPTVDERTDDERTAPVPVDFQWVLGFSPDGRHAYESFGDAWGPAPPCDGPAVPALVGVDLVAADGAEPVGFDAGLALHGRPEGLVFDDEGFGIVLDVCASVPFDEQRLTPVRLEPDGTLVATGDTFPIDLEPDQQWSWLRGIAEPGVAIMETTLGVEDEFDTWVREIRHIELATGLVEVVDQVDAADESRLGAMPVRVPGRDVSYLEIDDPKGAPGCEGYGVAASIAIDDGSGFRSMWEADQPTFSSVGDLHFGPDDLVAWTSGCEGYTTPWVGRIGLGGQIVDQHRIDTWRPFEEAAGFVELRQFRLTPDGVLVGLGERFDEDYANPQPILHRFELADDPAFVNSASPLPWIDVDDPLGVTLAGTGSWHVGELIGAEAGCRDQTLYASTSAGWVQGVDPATPLDRIVDFAASEPQLVEFDDGFSYTSRVLAVLTECDERSVGRQLWFALEPDVPGLGLFFQRADLPALADLLSIREERTPGDYRVDTIAEVVFRDGSIGEVLLEPVTLDG